MHNLVMICLAVAYLAANVYAIVKVRVSSRPDPNPIFWMPLCIFPLILA
jgi:hypothetical protein